MSRSRTGRSFIVELSPLLSEREKERHDARRSGFY